MRNNLLSVHEILVGMIIILFPFISSVTSITFLGGLGTEGSFFPAIIGVLLWIALQWGGRKGIRLPDTVSFRILCVFLVYVIVSGGIHIADFLTLEYQGVFGWTRFLLQTVSLIFYFLVTIYAYNFFVDYPSRYIGLVKGCIYISFFLAGTYSLIEIFSMFGNTMAQELLFTIDEVFRNKTLLYGRLRSLTLEASTLGVYLAVILPWMFSGFIESKTKTAYIYMCALIYIFFMNLLTISRTGYFMFAVEVILLVCLFRKKLTLKKTITGAMMVLLIVAIVLWSNVLENLWFFSQLDILEILSSLVQNDDIHDMSNISRYGSQMAAIRMFYDYPAFGVGFGMFGFNAVDYYPSWAWNSEEVVIWATNSWLDAAWPPVHGLYARILGELGAFGMLIWGAFLVSLYREIFICIRNASDDRESTFFKNCLLTLVVFSLDGFRFDGFRIIFSWVIYALIWVNYTKVRHRVENRNMQTLGDIN